MKLNLDRIEETTIPVGTSWLIGACMEARGKQDLWIHQKPEALKVLREQAIIQSAESSNRIEGVTVAADRLRPLLIGGARPRDRSEEELAGYRKALNWIFSRKRPVPLEPKIILHLHALAQGGTTGDAGEWKKRNNEIIEILPNGERRIRFVPTTAKETPKAIGHLCETYEELSRNEKIPPLLIISACVFDFLCIHPFQDGNGRVSRLLTLLLLQNHGYIVGRYISLERLIEESKEEYYRVLGECSTGWHEAKNDLVPWLNYFLSVIRRGYKEFEEQIESAPSQNGASAKQEMIRKVIESQVDTFTLGDLKRQLPAVSEQLIKKILSEMKKKKQAVLVGRGRGAYWKRI